MPEDNASAHTIRQEFRGIVIFIAFIWAVHLAGILIHSLELSQTGMRDIGLTPRTLKGLTGIITMPFLHVSWGHLVSNTIPLVVMLTLLAGSRARSPEIVTGIMLVAGILLWTFGRPATHVGASGLVFGLMSFLVVSGLLEKRLGPILVSILVGFMYGGTFFAGIMPFQHDPGISWDGHLWGGVAGALVAFFMARGLISETTDKFGAPSV